MAPSPEYDKEPKAPDKSAANISIIETKAPHSLLNDQQTISENKSSNTNTSVEVENNKNVEHLDDGQLKALLDEAITYKCPKDREGKSSLFNELLEEVEQDEQALPHSNSLQNLEQEALAAECALRRVRNHAPVSVRAGHGGSLPSDVDKSFLVGEEPRAGYLATVRCVNPPPLAERRVSASDANGPAELELLNRRSKPPFQMTYTARATLEISGSSVSSGRAVTTTTASNQVRTRRPPTVGPPDRTLFTPHHYNKTKQRKTSKVIREVNQRDGGADDRVDTADNETWHSERARQREATIEDTWGRDMNRKVTYAENRVDVADKTVRERSNKPTVKKGTGAQCYRQKQLMNALVPNVGGVAKNSAIKQTEAPEKPAWATNCTTKKEMPRNGATKNAGTKLTEAKKLASETNWTSRKESPRNGARKNSAYKQTKAKKLGFETKCTAKIASDDDNNNFYKSKNVCSDEVDERNNPDTDYLNTQVNDWYQGLDRYQGLNKYKFQSSLYSSNQTLIQNTNNNIPVPYYKPALNETLETEDVDTYSPQSRRRRRDEELLQQAFAAIYPPDKDVDDDVYDTTYNQHTWSTSRPFTLRDMQPKINKPLDILKNIVPFTLDINPRNIRKMTIGTPSITRGDVKAATPATDIGANRDSSAFDKESPNDCDNRNCSIDNRDTVCNLSVNKSCVRELSLDQDNAAKSTNNITSKAKLVPRTQSNIGESVESLNKSKFNAADSTPKLDLALNPDNTEGSHLNANSTTNYIEVKSVNRVHVEGQDVELKEMVTTNRDINLQSSFSEYMHRQEHLMKLLKLEMKSVNRVHVENQDVELKEMVTTNRDINLQSSFSEYMHRQEHLMKLLKLEDNTLENNITPDKISAKESENVTKESEDNVVKPENIKQSEEECNECDDVEEINSDDRSVVKLESSRSDRPRAGAQCVLAELPNNSYVFLTFPNSLSSATNSEALDVGALRNSEKQGSIKAKAKDEHRTIVSWRVKKALLDRARGEPAEREAGRQQVDSAIPFNCITTSEVADSAAAAAAPPAAADDTKSRGATFNGLPLPRAIYGSTAAAAPEEFKKSLDENGNSLQGLSSPLSGTSQFKKPRRKKSSKNETVMTSEEIDGYKGDKDLNEVLRFIESAAGGARAPKLPHRKHAHDDDKGKKRSAERRKDKEPELKRASSLEELSRTTLEELTDEPRRRERDGPGRERDGGAAPAKPERRSWGDDARDYYAEPAADAGATAATGGGFQTVTKKRRPRRRDERDEPRARAPEPRPRRVSAPPSDRSGDSNDDLDSVHSLPALAPRGAPAVAPAPAAPPAPAAAPAPAAVSYADIARTRHNIPDLIESCNFYAEGPVPAEPPPTVVDVDTYPALEPRRPPRAASASAAAAVAVGKPATDPPRTQEPPRRKERCSSLAESVVVAESPPPPAPDVVADRRPPVILLDSASRPKDMDGITFGFDINEQLLGGPAPRPRCDLVRDALEVWDGGDSGGGGSVAPAEGSVAVVAGCAALRYVPPEPPADTHHLLQIVDYVGSAWEDVVRCGSGKVRYFSE